MNDWGELLFRQRIGRRWATRARGLTRAMGAREGTAGQDAFFFGQLSLGCAEAVNGGGVFSGVPFKKIFNPPFKGGNRLSHAQETLPKIPFRWTVGGIVVHRRACFRLLRLNELALYHCVIRPSFGFSLSIVGDSLGDSADRHFPRLIAGQYRHCRLERTDFCALAEAGFVSANGYNSLHPRK